MTKFANDLIMDAAFDFLIAQADRLVVLSSYPAAYVNVAAATLAAVANGTITKANGDGSGRKAIIPAHSNISITASGTATHVGIVDDGGSRVLLVTDCTSQVLTSGGTVTVPSWDEEIGDPV